MAFVPGIYAKKPHPNAPSFIKAKLSIKRQALLDFLQMGNDEWINCEIKETKDGSKLCVFIDDWQKTDNQQQPPQQQPPQEQAPPSAFPGLNDQTPFG